jgi:hypothetical protein
VGARREVTVTRALDIDRAKLRAALRKLGDEYVFYMLDEAIELLPPTKLKRIVGKYLDLKQLRPDGGMPLRANLLDDVKAFEKASLAITATPSALRGTSAVTTTGACLT